MESTLHEQINPSEIMQIGDGLKMRKEKPMH